MRGQSKFLVIPQSVDFRGKITIGALVDLILTAAGNNADENGFGIRELLKQNSTWVLSRLAIEVIKMPKQYEWIYIDTWIDDINQLNTTRNFELKNEKMEVIGKARSLWAMINFETRKPLELDKLGGIQNHAEHLSIDMDEPMKLSQIKSDVVRTHQVRYSDIDLNHHVNTVKYIQWMSDNFSLDFYKAHQIKRFDINFMREFVYGDEVEIHAEEVEKNDFHFDLCKNKKSHCRGRLVFQET